MKISEKGERDNDNDDNNLLMKQSLWGQRGPERAREMAMSVGRIRILIFLSFRLS